jgi:hypothetical protein
MPVNAAISSLRQELLVLKAKDRKYLSIDRLLDFCDVVEDSPDNTDATHAIRDYEHRMVIWRHEVEQANESMKIVVDSAYQALKTLVFVAAGIAAALLAFLGSTWCSLAEQAKNGLVDALIWFAAPILGGALAYGLTYLTHLFAFEFRKPCLGECLCWQAPVC